MKDVKLDFFITLLSPTEVGKLETMGCRFLELRPSPPQLNEKVFYMGFPAGKMRYHDSYIYKLNDEGKQFNHELFTQKGMWNSIASCMEYTTT